MRTDIDRIRSLTWETREFPLSDEMSRCRWLWMEHNRLSISRLPIYIRAVLVREFLKPGDLQCSDS